MAGSFGFISRKRIVEAVLVLTAGVVSLLAIAFGTLNVAYVDGGRNGQICSGGKLKYFELFGFTLDAGSELSDCCDGECRPIQVRRFSTPFDKD